MPDNTRITRLLFWQIGALAGQVVAVALARHEQRLVAEVLSDISLAVIYGSALWTLTAAHLDRTTRNAAVLCLGLSPTLFWRATNPMLFAEGTVVSGPMFDDFLGPAGSPPNPAHWVHDVGPSSVHGWERGSLQTYTDSPDNVRLDGYGNLVIEARRSADGYTSGRIVTRGKLSFPYGTVVARMKLPAGQGLWPAFWMLGADIDTVGWPQCGEIDIIELINTGTTYNIALHAPGADLEQKGPIDDLSRDFHNYWMTRTPDRITVGIDEATLANFNKASFADEWVFDRPMFALLNLAVGGDWPGPPDESTPFPSAMIVDWFSFQPLEAGPSVEPSQSQE